jgi:pyruvate kinase
MKRTKIVATIGPASESIEALKDMIENGMNVCRLNFSHNDYEWHKKTIAKIRRVSKQKRKHIGIMADIQGPRIRVASKKKIEIEKGDKVFLTDEKSQAKHQYKKELILDWDNFYSFVHKRDRVFIEDGLMELEILKRVSGGCVAEVVTGGVVNPRKGVNIPSISKHLGFLTAKDLNDLHFIMSQDVDFVAASFVSHGKDIKNLREVMKGILQRGFGGTKKGNGKKLMPWIVAKMENKAAIENLDSIVKETDVIMVARGDLAIEMPQEKVGVFQKKIIERCIKLKKPVIVATQMMASMAESARPTRAEISDVTNAVVDQADAVMLSGETASGRYPKKVIETMSNILKSAEESPYNDLKLKKTNQFARMIYRLRNNKKKGLRKIIQAKTLNEALGLSSLRQEDVKIHLLTRKADQKNKASVIWGVD